MTRMCENESEFAPNSKGAVVSGLSEVILVVRLALRDVRPCIAQGSQQHFLLVKDTRFDFSLTIYPRKVRDSR